MHSNALQPHVTIITVDSRDTDNVLPVFQNLTHWNFFQTQSYKVKLTDIGDFLMWCRVASSNIRHKEVSRLKKLNSKWSDKSQGSKSFSSFLFYRYHLHINVFLFIYFGDASCCKCPSRSLRSSRQSSSELHSDRP